MRAAVAQVWGAPVARTCKMNFPDCSKCRDPGMPELRLQWGCDAPSERVVFRTACSSCDGAGCSECDEGIVEHHRCPTAILREDKGTVFWLRRALSAYSLYAEHGVLPRPDRPLDLQSAQFLQACEVFGSERSRWQEIEQAYIASSSRPSQKKED